MFSVIKYVSGKQVLVMGDFNYPGIDWDCLESDSEGESFLNLVQDCFLFQHVLTPTRGNNILDLVLSSEEGMVEDLQVCEHLANSDHNMISFKLVCSTIINDTSRTVYDFNKGNYVKMNDMLNAVDWDILLNGLEVNEMWRMFYDRIILVMSECIPKHNCRNKKKFPQWMTKEAKRACKSKSTMWRRYRLSKSYNDHVEYKRALNKSTYEYRKAKNNFECKLAKDIKKNPKSFYSYVRSKSKTKDRVGPLKDSSGQIIIDDEGMCNVLNDQFRSVFTQEVNCDITQLPRVRNDFIGDRSEVLSDIDITEVLVSNYLKKLKLNKAPGPDDLVPKVLVETAGSICKPLCKIFCKSLCDCVVPDDWKKANVCAIFKKGSKSEAGNYRPVSLTSHVCKVFETIIRDCLTVHLDRFKLINSTQHGFMRKKSCLTNLLVFLEYVCKAVDKGEPVDAIYLDFQKAFDKVPHCRLMLKINALGIDGKVAGWIKDWLANRKQRVVLNGCKSDWCDVASGVPQGSVLGPLLFLIFINDIDQCVSSKLLKFADDAKLFRVVSSLEEVNKLRDDLKNLFKWSQDWLMLFNLEKCKVVYFGKNNSKCQYMLGGKILEEGKEERDLGVLVSSDLKVTSQCSKVVKTANKVLGMISRRFTLRSKEIIMLLYKSLVRPHLEYCIQAWRPHLQKDIKLLENVQHRATRLIDDFSCLTYEQRLTRLRLTTLETRRLRGDLLEVFKIMKGIDNVDYRDFFVLSTNRSRGHSMKLFKVRFETNCGKFMFSNRVVDEWNLLTEDIISCNTVEAFKAKLDHHLRFSRGFI